MIEAILANGNLKLVIQVGESRIYGLGENGIWGIYRVSHSGDVWTKTTLCGVALPIPHECPRKLNRPAPTAFNTFKLYSKNRFGGRMYLICGM